MQARRAHFVTLRSIAIAMAAIEVVIHAVLVPSHLKETPYVGVLFIVATVILTAVLISLLLRRIRIAGWVVGALACAGMFVGFILSRTLGLPDYHETWTSDHGLGLMSLPPELAFIGAALAAVRVRPGREADSFPVRIEDAERAAEVRDMPVSSVGASGPRHRQTRPIRPCGHGG
jgi:Na+/proline symporter